MPRRIENITIKCPKCLLPHNYRLIIKYRVIDNSIVRVKDTEKLYVRRSFLCVGLNEEFDTKIPIYYSKNERIETVTVRH